jgi:hypothetical protein
MNSSKKSSQPDRAHLTAVIGIESGAARTALWARKAATLSALCSLPAALGQSADARIEESTAAAINPASEQELVARKSARRLRKADLLNQQLDYRLPHQRGTPDIVSALAGGADNCPGAPIPAGQYTAAAPFTDSGDTTGANDTITSLYYGYYSLLQVNGQDHVYTFTLTSRGPSPEIRITTPSSSYDAAIYIIDGSFTGACPASTSGGHYFLAHANRAGTTGAEVFGPNELNSLPLNVPLHLFIDSPAANNAGPYTLTMKDVTVAAPATRRKFDFDRDGKANISLFRPSNGSWYITRSQVLGSTLPPQFSTVQFGLAADVIVPEDYDGDGTTDIAVYRDGTWYVQAVQPFSPRPASVQFQFGLPGDVPAPADYIGEGFAQLAVFRQGTWYVRRGSNSLPFITFRLGLANDRPVPAAYQR